MSSTSAEFDQRFVQSIDLIKYVPLRAQHGVQQFGGQGVHVFAAAVAVLDRHARVGVAEQLSGEVNAGLVVDHRGDRTAADTHNRTDTPRTEQRSTTDSE